MTIVPATVGTFGDLVRWCRGQHGWSLRELARRLHVSAPFLSDIEHDRRIPKDVLQVAEVLDVSVSEIYVRLTKVDNATKKFLGDHPDVMLEVQRARAACHCEFCHPEGKK
jgi:transcriptional regulator with XRE-family HTH domain